MLEYWNAGILGTQNRNDGLLEHWNVGDIIFLWSPFLLLSKFSFGLLLFTLFHCSIIPLFHCYISDESCLPICHPFASVEVIQSISIIGFRPYNGARLTSHILPWIFVLLAYSFRNRNGILHMNQEQYLNGSGILSGFFGSNLPSGA